MRNFILSLVLFLASAAFGNTYYVDDSADAGGDGSTAELTGANCAFQTISAAITAGNAGGGPHTVNVAAGTYAEGLVVSDADWANGSIVGADRETVIVANSGGSTFSTNSDSVTGLSISTLTLKSTGGANAAASLSSGSRTFTDVDFVADATSTVGSIVTAAYDDTVFERCRWLGMNHASQAALTVSSSANAVTVHNCIFTAAKGGTCAGYILCSAASCTTYIYNCIIGPTNLRGLRVTGGTVNAANNVIGPAGVATSSSYAVEFTGGTLNLENNLLIGHHAVTAVISGTPTTDTDNQKTSAGPMWTSNARVGYILPSFDSEGAPAYVEAMETLLAGYGYEGTFFSTVDGTSGLDVADVRALITGGTIEFGSHSYHHQNLGYDHALAIGYSGADTNPTVALTAGRAIQFRTTEGNDDADLDTTAAAYDTLGEIVAAAPANWTVAKSTTDGQLVTGIYNGVEALSFLAMGATAVPCDIDFDKTGIETGLFKIEVADSKAAMIAWINAAGDVTDAQTNAVYACNSFGYPGLSSDDASRLAVIAAGYTSARAADNRGLAGKGELVDVDPTDLPTLSTGTIRGDGSEAAIRMRAKAIAQTAIEAGMVFCFIAHGDADLTADQWGYALDEWSNFGDSLVVTSHQLFAAAVTAAPWSADGDGTYSRTYAAYNNYLPLTGSPLINAGKDLGASYDEDWLQAAITGTWEIGPYNFSGTPAAVFNRFGGMRFGTGKYGPRGRF